ncbi:asparagine synthase-related protein [Actinosynnema mirum]|uniref:asparagine synthase (glutamine-hydrolyzing) n=1 Tax=Actinosynnema mirum (strain ATCC 29888 / DSM 43827 / JCM 3225 / NBRC 14064 / NCIMB 13271 / NRRL B-12336 / IMRU 3971 / 101) TaxID=446462 RepID=C6W9L5_ACTMD|nr:asparagine synthase-related protein [Actinosynnema mirum]ACU37232.1 asparagine synthase [Actinosynnema mirum DSM 43827]
MTFLVLPDRALPPAPADGVGAKEIRHHSGRPWLVGDWHGDDAVVAAHGPNRLVLLGAALVTPAELARRLRAVRSTADLDPLLGSIAGSFHALASIDGLVRVQGTLSTARQVCHAVVDGVTLASDRPDLLADLVGAQVDEEQLALELLAPFGPPWPLGERTTWRGVRVPRTGECLEIDRDGACRARRWWTPPDPVLPLGDGAAVRDALVDAVAARTGGGGTVSADLSGGLDSTTLCFLAARGPADLVTVHYEALGRFSDDREQAARAAAALGDAHHVVVPAGRAPDWFAPLERVRHDRGGPLVFARGRATNEHLAGLVAALGSRRHLQGIGGDELFHAGTMALHALARQRPVAAARHARAMRAHRRWSLATTARVLAFGQSYPRWLAGRADRLGRAPTAFGAPAWEVEPLLPPWIGRDAAATVRRALREAAASGPEPLSPIPAQHEMLRITAVNGRAVRRNSSIAAASGVTFEAPFTDDRVLEAVLSLRFADRIDHHRFKPVLGTAVRHLVPADVLRRETKNDASAELYAGLRGRRGELLALFEDSRLAARGLIDPAPLRRVLLGAHADARPLMPFDPTLACELWLRALDSAAFTAREAR